MPLPGFWEKNCPIKAGYFSRIIIINLSGGLKSSLDAEYRLVECVIHRRAGGSYLISGQLRAAPQQLQANTP